MLCGEVAIGLHVDTRWLMPSVSVFLMGGCRSDFDECEWMMQRNVTRSRRKSSM